MKYWGKILAAAVLYIMTVFSVSGENMPKYVFLFIGDGMGYGHVEVTELFCEQTGRDSLTFISFPFHTCMTTRSASHYITCSSASATAIACGHKVINHTMGVDTDRNTPLRSVAYDLHDKGMNIGLITSVSVNHATPGSFYALQPDRKNFYEIGRQGAESGFEFFGGSGYSVKEENAFGRVPLSDYFRQKGYHVYHGMHEYEREGSDRKMLYLSDDENCEVLPFSIDRKEGELSLKMFTQACLDRFSEDKGFFMMVEGGKIDWAAHAHDAASLIYETMDMDRCVKLAYDFYLQHPDETLIIVTADHETGGLGLGAGTVNLDVKLLENQKISLEKLSSLLKKIKDSPHKSWYAVKKILEENMGFWKNVKLTQEEENSLHHYYKEFYEKENTTLVVSLYAKNDPLATLAVDILNKKAGLGWTSTTHTAMPVPLYAVGVGAASFAARTDNTRILDILREIR